MTPLACPRCATELAPDVLACPACGWLVHGDVLRQLAAEAEEARRSDDLATANERWMSALKLLPTSSQQHAQVLTRANDVARQLALSGGTTGAAAGGESTEWKRGLPALGTLALLFFSKLKFLLLGLTKASTFVSMFTFFGVYWSIHGWPLALGIVVALYIHEMGHVSILRRLGIAADAPLFVPGVGAVVMLRQPITDPIVDARIGLAGPIWGSAAALGASAAHLATGAPIWLAIAQLTAFMNLFNLIPVWQLDGSRGFHALSSSERWMAVGAIVVALALTEQRLLVIVGLVAGWRAMQGHAGPGDTRGLATYATLVLVLSWLARAVG